MSNEPVVTGPAPHTEDAPKEVAILHVKVRYVATSMQQTIDSGVNGFALEMVAESLGDKDKLLDGGIMFLWPHDHKKRPVWIIVTGDAPFVASVEKDVPGRPE